MNNKQSQNLWLFIEVLAKRRNLIVTIITIATILAIGISFILPEWYTAKALLLPPKNISTSITGLGNISEAVSITSGLNLPILATTSDIYIRILKSRTITERIIDKFGLISRYGARNFEEAYLSLIELSDIYVTEEGLLSISVEDKDPQMAADISNSFVDELDNINHEIVAERIKQTKTFIETRLEQVKTELDSSRKELEIFQTINRTINFDQQTRLAIDQATNLKIILAEIDLNIKMSEINLGQDNAKLRELKRKKQIVLKQLYQLENLNIDSSFFSLPIASIPKLRGKYEELYGREKVAETLYRILLKQQEEAKIKEFEKMPTISVLDRAEPPQLRSRPNRTIIVISTFGISLIFSLFLAVLLEYFCRLKTNYPDDYNRVMFFINTFFGWLPGIKKGVNHK